LSLTSFLVLLYASHTLKEGVLVGYRP